MKLIKPSASILPQGWKLHEIKDHIEICGRTCYKSENSIKTGLIRIVTKDLSGNETEEFVSGSLTSSNFVDRLSEMRHGAMLEHGTVYLTIKEYASTNREDIHEIVDFYEKNKFSTVNSKVPFEHNVIVHYITTNYRVICENNRQSDLVWLAAPKAKRHNLRMTVKFVTDRGVANEFERHRLMSFGQESTRYCCYSSEKFDGELTFVQPVWMSDEYMRYDSELKYFTSNAYTEYCFSGKEEFAKFKIFSGFFNNDLKFNLNPYEYSLLTSFAEAEVGYMNLVKQKGYEGLKAEDARHVLPLGVKTEMVMTGDLIGWRHFINLRHYGTTGKPHPEAARLAEEFLVKLKQTDEVFYNELMSTSDYKGSKQLKPLNNSDNYGNK